MSINGPSGFPSTPGAKKEQIKFDIGEATLPKELSPDKGPKPNEDAFFTLAEKAAFGVFDGMGGYGGGDIASSMARDYVKQEVEKLQDDLGPEQLQEAIKVIFNTIDQHIHRKGIENPSTMQDIGTVGSFVKIIKTEADADKAIIAHVGDCRVYRLRNDSGSLDQLTSDDGTSSFEIQQKFNNLTSTEDLEYEEDQKWRGRFYVTKALGHGISAPNIRVVDIIQGDIFLLTSDGIHDNLTNSEIVSIISGPGTNESKAKALVQKAWDTGHVGKEVNFRSKKDDMTAIVFTYK